MNLDFEKSVVSILQQTDLYKLALHEQKHLGDAALDNAVFAFTAQSNEVLVIAHQEQNLNKDDAKVNDAPEGKQAGENQANEGAKGEQDKGNDQNQPENQEAKEKGEDKGEAKPAENPDHPQSAIEAPNNLQDTTTNIEHININAEESKLFLIVGHSEDLIYNDNGLPYLQQSVPRDLDIFHETSPFIPRFFELVKPPEAAATGGPCCIDPIPITVHDCGILSSGNLETLTNLLNASFKFSFEGFCNTGSSEITFLQTGGGALLHYQEGITEEIGGIVVSPILNNPSLGESFTIQVIEPDCSCCIPLNCDNPITHIQIDLDYWNSDYPLAIPCIDFFSGSFGIPVEFLDSHGNEWVLANNKKDFQLVCLEGTETAPIVFDLHNNGFQLTSAQESNVLLGLHGYTDYSAHIGWVGPDNGLLTYDYSGSGAIANKNFILTENAPGAKTDLQALEMLAGQNHGIIDSSNSIWGKLGMWVDGNQNGKMDTGEYHTLSQLGITGINLTQMGGTQNINGNTINSVISFNYADGTTGKAADVTLKLADVIQNNQSVIDDHSSTTSAPAALPSAPVVAAAPVAPTHVDSTVASAIEAVTTQQHPA